MSRLGLVTGRLAPGVWRTDAGDRSELANLAAGLGWDVRSGAIEHSADKRAYITRLAELVCAPRYVRANWDSLADGLRDLSIGDQSMWLIEPTDVSPFDAIAVEIFGATAEFWERHGTHLSVVWFGSAPAPRLEDIDPPRRSRR